MSAPLSTPSRRRGLWPALLATLVVGTGALLASAATSNAAPRTSLPVIERQVMCVTCKIPLNVAQSPQADRERVFIQSLIDRGESEGAIKHALVGQYGPAVLGLPSAHGFDLTAYLVPLAVVLALLILLATLLPRWHRRTRGGSLRGDHRAVPPIEAPDAARLEADLARFD